MKKSLAISTVLLISVTALVAYAYPDASGLFTNRFGEHHQMFANDRLTSTTNPMRGGSGWLVSPSGQYQTILQTDCNVVTYDVWRSWAVVWASNTVRDRPDIFWCKLVMQSDGNLVHYQCNSDACYGADFATNTAGHPTARTVLQDDGNLVVYEGSAPLWATWGH